MSKILYFIFLVPILLMAEGPRFKHKDAYQQQEFENVYQDLRSGNAKFVPYTGASGAIDLNTQTLTVGTVTAPSATNQSVLLNNGKATLTTTGDNRVVIGTMTPSLFSNTPLLTLVRSLNGSGGNGPNMHILNPGDGGVTLYMESEGTTPAHSRAIVVGAFGDMGGFQGEWWSGGPKVAHSIYLQDDQGSSYNILPSSPTFVIELDNNTRTFFHTPSANLEINFVANTSTMARLNNGALSLPWNPSFLVYPSAHLMNVTGDGTAYTIPFNTIIRDVPSYFSGDTYTASVTGVYHFDVTVLASGFVADNTDCFLSLVTSNRTYREYLNDVSVFIDKTFHITVDADMDAGDTAYVTMTVNGVTKGVDILATSSMYTYFSGRLVQ